MTGLREQQKAQRRRQIEVAAAELFVEKGFADATIEEIARRAMVSAPTVYNYYGTKGDLLLALVARGEEGIAAHMPDFEARAAVEEPVDLVTAVIVSNVRDTLSALSRELWGHVVAFVATSPDPEVAPKYLNTIAGGLAAAIESVLKAYQATGRVIDAVNACETAYMLTRLERIHFLNFVYLKSMTIEALEAAIAADVAVVMAGITRSGHDE